MAKKFMYVCFGILALAVAFHLGARYGQAGYLDHASPGVLTLANGYVLLADGTVWGADNPGSGWTRRLDKEPPIAVSQIKFWEVDTFVTASAELWHNEPEGWYNYGAPPGGAASTQPTTWSQIKAEFGE